MKKFFYGISVFCFLCLLWAGYYGTYRMTELNGAKENTEQFLKLGQKEGETSVREVSGESMNDDEVFYLKEKDGFVMVYLRDRSTVYETTSISVELLPEALRKEIMDGKYVKSRAELYGFLENYSS